MDGQNMRLQGKRIAFLTSEMYDDLEFWYPYFRVLEEGGQPVMVSLIESPQVVLSRHSFPLKTDTSVRGRQIP